MGDRSPSQHKDDNNRITPEIQTSLAAAKDETEGASLAAVIGIDIPSKYSPRRIHRVPRQLRAGNNQSIYEPVVLSIGPYHHGKPEFRQVEEFKNEVLNSLVPGSEQQRILRHEILRRVYVIKSYYVEVEYEDEKWADMILRDTCFLIYFMQNITKPSSNDRVSRRLGFSTIAFLHRDFYMLENQIPLWIIRFVFNLIYHKEAKELLRNFLSYVCSVDTDRRTALPSEDLEHDPLYLIEAVRTVLVEPETATGPSTVKEPNFLHQIILKWKEKWSSNDICPALRRANFPFLSVTDLFPKWKKRRSSSNNSQEGFQKDNFPFRSVTELQAKGIYFEPSSQCLKDLKFDSHGCYGVLRLPIRFVGNVTKVYFSNIIAYEMSPETETDGTVISYVNFMKSLIENPRDVKELRRKGILFSSMGNEEVAKVFREIDTYGANNFQIFEKVKTGIEDYCNSKAKTWMAEFYQTYFRSPCTAIALLAATLLLCLTVLQTYYTIPSSKVKLN